MKYTATTVYPRVCGGTLARLCNVQRTAGLSPRVRGNRLPDAVGGGVDGSIPACAGEPQSWASGIVNATVYPRVCGGTGEYPEPPAGYTGLSPRVRGNH